MAKPDITLLGATYSGVSGVTLPKNGGGTATFPWVEGSETKTANGTYDVTNLAELVVNVSGGGGGGPVSKKQVNFIDYDGTLLYSYTAQEANALNALPTNPSHTGLTAQGWNWTLAQIKAQLTAMPDGDVWVGQMYITASGNTEIDVSMPKGRLSPILTICVNGTITVDWGDNTTPDTVTGTSLYTRQAVPHTYASPGDYTIVISVTSGGFNFYGSSTYPILRKNTNSSENRVYTNCIQNIRLGSGITTIYSYAFYNCYSLASITVPDGITAISNNAFYNCYSLASITVPDGITIINASAFYNCYSLATITIPDGITTIDSSSFYYCCSLPSITIPDGVKFIYNAAFQNCSALSNISIPDSVTTISSSAFASCSSLSSITIPDGITAINSNAFYNCYSLSSITIPDGITAINSNAFQSCSSLSSITIPDSVTTIYGSAFSGCSSLASVAIPDSVTTISSSAFASCHGVAEYHFLPTTPPTLGNANAFQNIVSDCVIYVPYSADHSILEAYQTASNWSTYASYMQEEPQ